MAGKYTSSPSVLATSELEKIRRDQILGEIEQILGSSKAAEFQTYVQQFQQSNREFLGDNPGHEGYGDYYGIEYEQIEQEALKRDIRRDEDGHLPHATLSLDLHPKLSALSHAVTDRPIGATHDRPNGATFACGFRPSNGVD